MESTAHYLRVALTADEAERLNIPISAEQQGGFQNLLRRLQGDLKRQGAGFLLGIKREDAERLVRYSANYGGGGWQGRIRPVVEKVQQELARVPAEDRLFGQEELSADSLPAPSGLGAH